LRLGLLSDDFLDTVKDTLSHAYPYIRSAVRNLRGIHPVVASLDEMMPENIFQKPTILAAHALKRDTVSVNKIFEAFTHPETSIVRWPRTANEQYVYASTRLVTNYDVVTNSSG
jgi:hypothetical protein